MHSSHALIIKDFYCIYLQSQVIIRATWVEPPRVDWAGGPLNRDSSALTLLLCISVSELPDATVELTLMGITLIQPTLPLRPLPPRARLGRWAKSSLPALTLRCTANTPCVTHSNNRLVRGEHWGGHWIVPVSSTGAFRPAVSGKGECTARSVLSAEDRSFCQPQFVSFTIRADSVDAATLFPLVFFYLVDIFGCSFNAIWIKDQVL